MTIKKCTNGTKIDTKTALKVEVTNMYVNLKAYRVLWFTCPCCMSTFIMRKPAKSLPALKSA